MLLNIEKYKYKPAGNGKGQVSQTFSQVNWTFFSLNSVNFNILKQTHLSWKRREITGVYRLFMATALVACGAVGFVQQT